MSSRPISRVQPALAAIPPAPSRLIWWLVLALLPLLLRWRLLRWLPAGITGLELQHGERLAQLLVAFRQKRCRLLLAFRHSDVDDPLCALWLLSRGLPPELTPQPVHFLYDRGMPLWAGQALGWVLSRLGGVAVRRGRQPDWGALRQARQLLRDGPHPFALAPEGATNGHGDRIGPLQPGAARLALWCRDDLRRAGRPEAVWIVPIGLRYRYPATPWRRLERLLQQLERQMGLPAMAPALPARRLRRLGLTLLDALEHFYGGQAQPGQSIDARLAALRERVLAEAERRLKVAASGSPVERCRRLEEVAWQAIYPDNLPPRRRLAPLQRGLADWAAREADLALRHMRLVETFVAVRGSDGSTQPPFERCAETALLLHDGLSRLRGEGLPCRPRLGGRTARLIVAEPILVDAGSGQGRGAVATLTTLLAQRLSSTLERD